MRTKVQSNLRPATPVQWKLSTMFNLIKLDANDTRLQKKTPPLIRLDRSHWVSWCLWDVHFLIRMLLLICWSATDIFSSIHFYYHCIVEQKQVHLTADLWFYIVQFRCIFMTPSFAEKALLSSVMVMGRAASEQRDQWCEMLGVKWWMCSALYAPLLHGDTYVNQNSVFFGQAQIKTGL